MKPLSELVQRLYIKIAGFEFDNCSSCHSETSVHKQRMDGPWMGCWPLVTLKIGQSYAWGPRLHMRTLCFQFDDCSSSHSPTMVFTRHKSVKDGNKMAASDLEIRSRSCMIKLVQVFISGVYIIDLGFLALAILKLECSQDTKVWPTGSKWPPVTLKLGQGHAWSNLSNSIHKEFEWAN